MKRIHFQDKDDVYYFAVVEGFRVLVYSHEVTPDGRPRDRFIFETTIERVQEICH